MSLIVARKINNQIAIVSDTKLTYKNHDTKNQKNNPIEGLIKIVIVNPNICFAFAGEFIKSENIFTDLTNPNISLQETLNILCNLHKTLDHKADFIVCEGSPTARIYKIQSGESREVVSAWIGDHDAFNYFQETMMGEKRKEPPNKSEKENKGSGMIIKELNLQIEEGQTDPLFSKMADAMDSVIESGKFDSVGGFRVMAIFKDVFKYSYYSRLYRNQISLPRVGTFVLNHGVAEEGAYSINFLGSTPDNKHVALHIKQGNIGIIYSKKANGLMEPESYMLDEIDFFDYILDNYKFQAPFATEDRISKYRNVGIDFLKNQDFKKAIEIFNKGIKYSDEKIRAEFYYYKGLCLFNLGDKIQVMQIFQQAIHLDSRLQKVIMEFIMGQR